MYIHFYFILYSTYKVFEFYFWRDTCQLEIEYGREIVKCSSHCNNWHDKSKTIYVLKYIKTKNKNKTKQNKKADIIFIFVFYLFKKYFIFIFKKIYPNPKLNMEKIRYLP